MILTSLIVSFLTLVITAGVYGEAICGKHCDNGVLSAIGSFLFGYAPCTGTCGVCAPSNTLVYNSGNPLNVCNKCYPGKKTCPDNRADGCQLTDPITRASPASATGKGTAPDDSLVQTVARPMLSASCVKMIVIAPKQNDIVRTLAWPMLSAQIAEVTLTAPRPHNIVPTPAVPLPTATIAKRIPIARPGSALGLGTTARTERLPALLKPAYRTIRTSFDIRSNSPFFEMHLSPRLIWLYSLPSIYYILIPCDTYLPRPIYSLLF
ncbi:hypothetical protein B0H13DRAFT_1884615 [Mycena leptocephala]|nr:hypothetical protein B0H13DRAFT_1884615 [Mycena leptocephala]